MKIPWHLAKLLHNVMMMYQNKRTRHNKGIPESMEQNHKNYTRKEMLTKWNV